MTIPTADCNLPTRHTPPDTTGRGGPMNDKIRAWGDARICQRCWKSRIPFTNRHGQPEIDCTCGGAAARQAELDRRHQQSLADAADTVELGKWRGRMRGKGRLGS